MSTTPPDNSPTVEQWENRVKQYRQDLKWAEEGLKNARSALAEFQVGDLVEARSGSYDDWRPAIVRAIEPFSMGNPWYRVSYRLKNGSWGTPRRAYSHVRKLPEVAV